MTRALLALIATTMCLSATTTRAQSPANIEVQFKTAQAKADVEGDLKGAIALYERLAKSADRSIAARALIRMAECYRKLGDTEARRIYERLVRDYSDQEDVVALARAQLGDGGLTIRGDRAVWTGPKVDMFGRVSPDGRFISYVDWAGYDNVAVHDLGTNSDRLITTNKNWGDASNCDGTNSAISPDGRQVAYGCWFPKMSEIRISAVSGNQPSRTLLTLTPQDANYVGVRDWSPDGKQLVLGASSTSGTNKMMLASIADGSTRVLKSWSWNGPDAMFFSPDGRYLAFDLRSNDDSLARDVFVIAIDSAQEVPIVVQATDDRVAGWSPDGRYVLFTSDRTESTSLWAQPLLDGKPAGNAALVKTDVGWGYPLGLANGALYFHKEISSRDVKVARIDLNAGTLVGPVVHFTQGLLPGPEVPSWSPDGSQLAYLSRGRDELAIRNVATGAVRRLTRKLMYSFDPRWSPDGRRLLVSGRDVRGRQGIYQVDAQSGDVALLVANVGGMSKPQWSLDGRKIYHRDQRGNVILERDLTSGTVRELLINAAGALRSLDLSPDGKWLAVRIADSPTKISSAVVVSVETRESRELMKFDSNGTVDGRPQLLEWTPDRRQLLMAKKSTGRFDLCLIDAQTAAVRTLPIDVSQWEFGLVGGFSLSQDGRSIAFLMGNTSAQVWALENFLPSTTARK